MRIPERFRKREALIYQLFGDPFPCNETDLQEFFAHESKGTPCNERNGFLVGKKRLQITMDMWEADKRTLNAGRDTERS